MSLILFCIRSSSLSYPNVIIDTTNNNDDVDDVDDDNVDDDDKTMPFAMSRPYYEIQMSALLMRNSAFWSLSCKFMSLPFYGAI